MSLPSPLDPCQVLKLGHNQIKELPPALASLKALTHLDVSHNALTALANLEALADLTHLDVSGRVLGLRVGKGCVWGGGSLLRMKKF